MKRLGLCIALLFLVQLTGCGTSTSTTDTTDTTTETPTVTNNFPQVAFTN